MVQEGFDGVFGERGEGPPQVSPIDRGLAAIPIDFPDLQEVIKQKISDLGSRTVKRQEVKEIIRSLCSVRPLTGIELAKILDRNPNHLRYDYLSKMIKNNELEFVFPNQPAHPQQAS